MKFYRITKDYIHVNLEIDHSVTHAVDNHEEKSNEIILEKASIVQQKWCFIGDKSYNKGKPEF